MPRWVVKTNYVKTQSISINMEPVRYALRKWIVELFSISIKIDCIF